MYISKKAMIKNKSNLIVTYRLNQADIIYIDTFITATGTVDVGGFMPWPGAHTIATNCTTEGTIDASGVTGTDNFIGGFFGNLGWNCDLGQMGHEITNYHADVDIISGGAPAGGFVGSATNSNDQSMYATFINCSASGDVTNVSGIAGGFAGEADRGDYDDCSANGTVVGAVAGGFIGHIKDVTAKYDGRYPAGTRPYLVDEIFIDNCTGSSGLIFIGKIDEGTKVTIDGVMQ